MGSPVKVCQHEERQMADVSRKSIVMKVAAKAGTILSEENFASKGQEQGYPQSFNELYGLKLSVDKNPDEILKLTDFE